MRRLKGAIPRAYTTHKTRVGRAYGGYVRALLARLPALPDSARPLLKAYGVAWCELDALTQELADARQRRRLRDQSRVRRAMLPLRTQVLALERRLEELAAATPIDMSTLFHQGGREGSVP